MNTDLQVTEQNLMSKSTMIQFVKDVADFETRALSMREAADRCRQEASKIITEAEDLYEDELYEFEEVERWRDEFATNGLRKPTLEKRYFFEPVVNVAIVAFAVPQLFLLGLLVEILVVIYCLLIDPFIIPIQNAKRVKKYNRMLQEATREYNEELEERDARLREKKEQLKEAQADLNREKKRAAAINARADELIASAKTVEKNILQCYSLNVIKPAYRSLVCVAILNEIFQNDKADTMREAMILCDQVMRHQEQMAGLNNIFNALNTIAQDMRGINNTLNSINTNISMISQDVYRMAENQAQAQARNEALQERIAYAAESIKQSADKAEFYIDQHRAGNL